MITTVKKYLKAAYEAEPLLDRAYLYLEDGDRAKAAEYFDKVLDKSPREPFAYLGKLIISEEMEDVADLLLWESSYSESPDFVKILRFTEGELHDAFERISADRDDTENRYKKALAAEKAASTFEEMKAAYYLYADVRDYADAEDRMQAIAEAVSVIKFYKDKGVENIRRTVNDAKRRRESLEQSSARIVSEINKIKAEALELKNSINAKIDEHNSLGIFKGKQKKMLALEVEDGKIRLREMDNKLIDLRKKMKKNDEGIGECDSVLPLAVLLEDVKPEVSEKNVNGVPDPDEEIELLDYVDDKEPLRLLKDPSILSVVVKDPCALNEIFDDERAAEIALANKKTVEIVGKSPALVKLAEISYTEILKIPELVPYVPFSVKQSYLRQNLAKGATVALGSWSIGKGEEFLVQWKVVECRGDDEFFLVSKDPVEWGVFNQWSHTSQKWDNCTLRSYMNGEMLKKMFTAEERKLIMPVTHIVGDTRSDDDYLFIPSYDEMKRAGVSERAKDAWLREPVRHLIGSPIPVDYWFVRVFDESNPHKDCDKTDTNHPIVPAMWIKVKPAKKK